MRIHSAHRDDPRFHVEGRSARSLLGGLLRAGGTGASARILLAVLATSLGAFAFAVAPALAVAPEAPSMEVQSFTATTAQLHGVLNPANAGEDGTYEFLYRVSPTVCTGEGKGRRGLSFEAQGEEVNEELTGLAPNTTYTVCLLVRNLKGEETVGPSVHFTTLKPAIPVEAPEAKPADPIGATEATLNGVLNPGAERKSEPGAAEFRYRQSVSECEGENEKSVSAVKAVGAEVLAGEKEEAVKAPVTELLPNTNYTFCLRVTNAAGEEALGVPKTFTTLSEKPGVIATSLSHLGSSGVTVEGQIDPGGLETSYSVQYGTSTAYGFQTVPVSVSPGAAGVSVAVPLTELTAGTEYHVRLLVTNGDGTEPGPDVRFTTYVAGSSILPDGRVMEMVTPAEDESAEVYEAGEGLRHTSWPFQAAADGDAITYVGTTFKGGNGASSNGGTGNRFMAVRGPQGGWTQTNITPTGSESETRYEGFSEELSSGVLVSTAEAPLAPTNSLRKGKFSNNPNAYEGLFSTRFDGLYSPLFDGKPPHRVDNPANYEEHLFYGYGLFGDTIGDASSPLYAGSSASSEDLLFEANDQLLDGEGPPSLEAELNAIVEKEVEGFAENLKLIKEEKEQTEGRAPRKEEREAIVESFDSRNELYVSREGHLGLVNVLPDGRVAPGATFGGGSQTEPDFTHDISADGSRIFWTLETAIVGGQLEEKNVVYVRVDGGSTEQVSRGAARFWTASPDGADAFYTEAGKLWRFDVESEERAELAGVAGGVVAVLGANETGPDGSYVYFVSTEALPGEGQAGQKPVEGQDNLYVDEPDTATGGSRIAFIAALGGSEADDWATAAGGRVSGITPDGRALTFTSRENLTDKPYPGEGEEEVYVYDASEGSLFCASCRAQASGGHFPSTASRVYTYRHISEDGNEVFFDSAAPLVASDLNGKQDVYEWQRDGSGGCAEVAGCVYLLSGGVEGGAYLLDASVSGDDVFFVARQKLVPEDETENAVLYDARVDGALPVAPPECSGTGCQGVPSPPPIFATPASVTFNGVGNFPSAAPSPLKKATKKVTKCKRGFAKDRKGRCVKKKNKKKAKRSSDNRRAK